MAKKVIMLPANKASKISLYKSNGNLGLNPEGNYHAIGAIEDQELYVIDTEAEIVDEDWAIDKQDGLFHACSNWGILDRMDKVVASSDKSLNLPLINKEFIQLFVEKQGKVGEVTVSIEDQGCEEWQGDDYTGEPVWNGKLVAIVTPKEEVDDVESAAKDYMDTHGFLNKGSVTVSSNFKRGNEKCDIPLKDAKEGLMRGFKAGAAWQKERMYSRDEVESLLRIAMDFRNPTVISFSEKNKWIAQNLKK